MQTRLMSNIAEIEKKFQNEYGEKLRNTKKDHRFRMYELQREELAL